jgi:hypothetical protein
LGTFGAACRRECSLGNTLQHHEIGHDTCSAGPFKNRVSMGAPKLPYQFPLIVHYPGIECEVRSAECGVRSAESHDRASISL